MSVVVQYDTAPEAELRSAGQTGASAPTRSFHKRSCTPRKVPLWSGASSETMSTREEGDQLCPTANTGNTDTRTAVTSRKSRARGLEIDRRRKIPSVRAHCRWRQNARFRAVLNAALCYPQPAKFLRNVRNADSSFIPASSAPISILPAGSNACSPCPSGSRARTSRTSARSIRFA